MIKVVYCFRKRWGMTDQEFSHHWEHVHGPLGARIPGLRKLVQNHTVFEAGSDSEYDGMAELWFEDLAALNAARASPEWAWATEDEANFIEPGTTTYFIVEEKQIAVQPLALEP
jgi:uncharacterized protein (TIGR02118 family)